MATNNRDVRLTLGVDVEGSDSVEKLAIELDALAAEGKATAGAFSTSGAAAGHLQEALAELTNTTKQQRAAESTAQAEAKAAKRALDEQREALARLKLEYATSGGNADKYRMDVLALRTAILDSRAALRQKQDALADVTTGARLAAAAEQKLTAEIKNAHQQQIAGQKELRDNADKTGGSLRSLGEIARGAWVHLTALFGSVAGVTEFVRANVELENIGRTLHIVTGSSEAASKEMAWLKGVSKELGLELISTAKSYAQFAASTKGTALEGEQSRVVFESISRAMSAAGKSADETSDALNALAQMVSKGTVSMEELRGQLGDRLPGALKAAADGLGITTDQLVKMVSDGQVLAVDLLPKLALALDRTYKAGDNAGKTLGQEWTIFRNAITETLAEIGSSGILQSLLELGRIGAASTSAAVNGFLLLHTTAVGGLQAIITTISDFNKSLFTVDFTGFLERTKATFSNFGAKVSAEFDRAKESVQRFSDQSTILKAALDLVGPKLDQTAAETSRLATANAKAAATADQARPSWEKLTATFDLLNQRAIDNVHTAEKAVAARKAEGDASVALARLSGNELEIRKAIIAASEATEKAVRQEALAKVDALMVAQQELREKEKLLAQMKVESPERKKQVEDLKRVVDIRQQDADKAIAQADASRVLREQARLEAEVHKDNSGRLFELRSAYAAATVELERLRVAKERGTATTQQVTEAELAAARAAALYADALADQKEKIEANAHAKQASFSLEQAGIQLAIEQTRTVEAIARAKGDEKAAMEAANRIRELEIELLRLQAEAIRAEAEATLAKIAVDRAELEMQGKLTDARKKELDALEALARVKLKQADISDEMADRIGRVKNATDEAAKANRNAADSYDGMAGSMDRAASSANRLADGVQRVNDNLFYNKDKFSSDAQGKALEFTSAPAPWMDANGNWVYTDANGQMRRSRRQPIPDAGGAWKDPDASGALNAPDVGLPALGSGNAAQQPQESAPLAGNSTHTVNINMPGKNTTINVASAADANTLTGFLRQLESAANAAS
ncbi:MAG TPA: tape measure protein [Burkholderiaceae bacterium]|nr:tape measure protein [Burkholderiaceae bacterium]